MRFALARPDEAAEGTPYAQERDLRYRVLRAPQGMPRGSERFPFEAEALHLVAIDDAERVVGCVMFHPEAAARGRLLQMAVEESLRGQGLGRRLVERLEAICAERGYREVTLHARAHVCGFYERLGYAVFGEPFEEVGVAHRHMRKVLAIEG